MDKKTKTNELVKQLMENEGVNDVVGLQSILKDMLKQGVETLLTSELDEELGYDKYDRKKEKDNYRNGYSKKKVRSDLGELDLSIPRDRNNEFEPDDRIVSLSQPWVRPIVRGKVNANVEFGAKLCISVVDGYMRVEELRWDAYNESTTLQDTVERYRKRTGSYPQKILADKIYRTRKNLSYYKEHNIQLNGPPLGRPLKDKKLYAQLCRQEKLDAGERNEVEGKFGTAKRCYGMSRMSTRFQTTSKADIYMTILTMNLVKKFKASCALFISSIQSKCLLLIRYQSKTVGVFQ